MEKNLTHIGSDGEARMVDVGPKIITARRALAFGEIKIKPDVIAKIKKNQIAKGNVFAAAKIAGILAAKRVDELIPLCHTLPLDAVHLKFDVKRDRVLVTAEAKTESKTGVEMEALTAATLACLTIYDMVKALDKEMVIGPIYLLEKSGGRSGHYKRMNAPPESFFSLKRLGPRPLAAVVDRGPLGVPSFGRPPTPPTTMRRSLSRLKSGCLRSAYRSKKDSGGA